MIIPAMADKYGGHKKGEVSWDRLNRSLWIGSCHFGFLVLTRTKDHVNYLSSKLFVGVFFPAQHDPSSRLLRSLFSKTENPALILTDRSSIQNSGWVNICTSLFFGQTCWAVEGGGGPSWGLTGRETASARSGPSSPLGFKIRGETKGVMLQACHRASAFVSRFNTRERRFILTHFIESIPSVMAKLLDCYGNCWEKKVSLCLCARLPVMRRRHGTPLQVQQRSKWSDTMGTQFTQLKIKK